MSQIEQKRWHSVALALTLLVPSGLAARKADLFSAKLAKDRRTAHALDRLTFGPRPGDAARVKTLGLKKWIDLQLHPERIPENPILEAKLAPLESLSMTPVQVAQHYPLAQMIKAIEPAKRADQVLDSGQIKTLKTGTLDQQRRLLAELPPEQLEGLMAALPRGQRQKLFAAASTEVRRKILLLNAPRQVVAYDLLESKLIRAIYSNRQLAEQLDDFWFNHFNVYYDKGADRILIPSFERDAIRPHVLGRFRDLLGATAKSPAMLFYLDNFQSVKANGKSKRGLNENYARELMELHTLGVDGGYTQHDVVEVARCLTGWTIRQPRQGGGFYFNDKVHDQGEKVVLGQVIPAGGGIEDGEKVLDILATHPSTAKFISRKLAQRFVADNPPEALVDRMAKTFLDKDGDIRMVLKTMLASKEFWSQGAYQAKVKSPLEMVSSAVRALDAEVDDAFVLANQVGQLGEPLYRKQEPTGYSSLNSEWVNSAALLSRMNFAVSLAQNKVPGVKVDLARFGEDDAAQIARALLGHDMSGQSRNTIEAAMKTIPENGQTSGPPVIAGLILGSPEFQRR